MASIENDDMIEQVPTAVADPTFCNTVLPRTSESGFLRLDTKALDGVDPLTIEVRGSIKNQVLGRRIAGECPSQLSHDPGARWMPSNSPMEDSPPVMRNDEEAVQHAKRQSRHGEEVHRGDGFPMIAQRSCPSFCRLRISWRFAHPAQYSSFRDIEAKHLQFTVSARRTPGRVLGHHAENESAHFWADALSTRTSTVPREPGPIRLESGTVPSHHGLRLDKNQCLLPTTPEPTQYHPEESVGISKLRVRMFLLQDRKLLAKRQILQKQVAARANQPGCKYGQKAEEMQHKTDLIRSQVAFGSHQTA
jgi:hypothetical protein